MVVGNQPCKNQFLVWCVAKAAALEQCGKKRIVATAQLQCCVRNLGSKRGIVRRMNSSVEQSSEYIRKSVMTFWFALLFDEPQNFFLTESHDHMCLFPIFRTVSLQIEYCYGTIRLKVSR